VRGTNHPLSEEELLANSDKIDILSSEGFSVKLADGTKSNTVKVNVYAMHKPMVAPLTDVSEPLIIYKEIGKLTAFVDLSLS
jgi:hypothetical protein